MMTGIRFASKIHVLPMEAFLRLPLGRIAQESHYVHQPWLADDRVPEAEEAFTDMAWACNAGGFTNGHKLGLYHLIPTIMEIPDDPQNKKSWSYTRFKLWADAQKLKFVRKLPLRGLLTGGRTCYPSSPKLRDRLLDFYKALGIPVSIIWGQLEQARDGDFCVWTNLFGSAPLDTWVLTTKNDPGIHTMDDLKQHFSQIEIAQGDELIFGGTPIVENDRLIAVEGGSKSV